MTSKEEMFYGNLANEIVAHACKDYADAYFGKSIRQEHCKRHYGNKEIQKLLDKEEEKLGRKIHQGSPEHTKLTVEHFFHSDWFQQLTGNKVDPDRLLKEAVINAIDDALWIMEQAFSFQNHPQLILRIETPPGEENIGYPLPPLLADVCYNALRKKAKALRKEAQDLSEGHTPMVTRKVLK